MTETILGFVEGLVSSLAWPTVLLALGLIFRGELANILDGFHKRIAHIRRATGPGGTSVEFYEYLEEAREAREGLHGPGRDLPPDEESPIEEDTPDLPFFVDREKRETLKQQSPAAAFLVVYTELEAQVRSLYRVSGLEADASRNVRRRRTVGGMAHYLTVAGFLPRGFDDVFEPVTSARNAVAHSTEAPDRAELRELVDICAELALSVSTIRGLHGRGIHPFQSDDDAAEPAPDSQDPSRPGAG